MSSKKTGVVLFQLGGPDSLESIEPFLYNLFCDPDIIDFPFARLARKPLAKLISTSRAKHVAHHYAEIGGRSPILPNTQLQAEALERELRRDMDAKVAIAMRYWHPMTTAAIAEMAAFAPEELVLLPLYPQYSKTTTGSSVNEWNRCFEWNGWRPNVRLIETFYEDPAYLDSVVSAINACLGAGENLADLDMVFSAHSVPIAVIEAGDPYQRQIEHTVDLVWERGGWPSRRHTCYQSKVGASKWLRPSMHETVKTLAAAGSKHVLVVPISFVSDHVETLHEIDIEHREQARELGIEEAEAPFGAYDHGREAVVAGLAAGVRGIDRRFDARIPEIIEGPSARDGGVWMRFRLTLCRAGLPDLVVDGTHLAVYENGAIIRLDESVSPETCAATRDYLGSHDAALRPAASPPVFPTDARDLARIDAAAKAALVRCYGHAKSRQDIAAALAICSERFSIETVSLGVASRDKQDTASQLEIFFRAFPDYAVNLDGLACNETSAACWGTARMTFAGDFLGQAPTNRTAVLPIFCVFTFEGAQLASERFFFDLAALCEQTGLPLDLVRDTLRQLRAAA